MGKLIFDRDLKRKFEIMGYEYGNEIVNLDNSLVNILRMIDDNFSTVEYDKWIFTKGRLLSYAKKFLNNHFDLHSVYFISEKISQNISFLLESGLLDYRTILGRVREISKLKSPYELPIKFECDSMVNKKLLEDSVYFCSISINKKNSKMIVPEYIHEVVHTQLDSKKGVIINYHNREVISIFLEMLSAIMLDSTGKLLRNAYLIRYENLLQCLKYIDSKNDELIQLEASVYVVSTLKACNLFDQYLSSGNKIKEEMLSDIQNVFDGKETVEDFLERYNVSLENSKNEIIIKRQLKL